MIQPLKYTTTKEPGLEKNCSECGGDIRKNDSNSYIEWVCSDCGLITDEQTMDHGRAHYDSKETPENVSNPDRPLSPLYNNSVRTTFHVSPKEDIKNRHQIKRLSKLNNRRKTQETNLMKGLTEINRMGSALENSKRVRETAAVIFRKAHSEGLLVGRSIESVASASLYVAFQEENIPQTLSRITNVSRLADQNRIYSVVIKIQRHFSLTSLPTSPEKHLPKCRSEMGISYEYEAEAKKLLENIPESERGKGRCPEKLAISALFSASITHPGLPRLEMKSVAANPNISEVTVRKQYREILAETEVIDITMEEIEEARRVSAVEKRIQEIQE